MTDPIILSQSRKRQLRLAFREIQAEQGGGVVVAFANARAPHVQEALEGLAKTNSITDPVYTNDGYAVVKTVIPEDEGTPIDLGENAPASDEATFSEPSVEPIEQQNMAGEELVTPADAETSAPELKPPPTSGPGSGTDAWREYAIVATGLPVGTFDGMDRSQIIEQLRLKGLLGG